MLVTAFLILALIAFLLGAFGASLPPLNWDALGKAALVAAALAGWSL